MTEPKRSARTSYLIDGVAEAMAELIAALQKVGMDNLKNVRDDVPGITRDSVRTDGKRKSKSNSKTKTNGDIETELFVQNSTQLRRRKILGNEKNLRETCLKQEQIHERVKSIWRDVSYTV